MRPFRQRRLKAKVLLAAWVALWSAGLTGTLFVAALTFTGVQAVP